MDYLSKYTIKENVSIPSVKRGSNAKVRRIKFLLYLDSLWNQRWPNEKLDIGDAATRAKSKQKPKNPDRNVKEHFTLEDGVWTFIPRYGQNRIQFGDGKDIAFIGDENIESIKVIIKNLVSDTKVGHLDAVLEDAASRGSKKSKADSSLAETPKASKPSEKR